VATEKEEILARIRARRGFVAHFHQLMVDIDPKIAESYEQVSGLVLRREGNNPLDDKTQSLVALGVATAVGNDREGVEQFINRATRAGASDREIMAAIMVAAFIAGMPKVEYAASIFYEMKEGKRTIDYQEPSAS
jgi:alkylhydroperoxidase/carboxymuconolactone decarboxylase family protein YurZ